MYQFGVKVLLCWFGVIGILILSVAIPQSEAAKNMWTPLNAMTQRFFLRWRKKGVATATFVIRLTAILIYLSIQQGMAVSSQELIWKQTNGPYGGTVYEFLTTPDGKLYAGGKYGIYRSTDGGSNWTVASTGLLPIYPSINSLAVMGTTLYAGTQTFGVYRSTDGGNNWTKANSGLPTYPSINSLAVMGTTLYAGTQTFGVYRSTDGGNNWTAANSGLPASTTVNSLAVMGTTLYAGTYLNGVYRSTDGGNNWTAANSGLPASTTVNSLAVMGTTLYAASSDVNGIYHSTDGGNNWTKANSGLPTYPSIYSLTVMGTTLYAGNYHGVYRSMDGGNNWSRVSIGLPPFTAYSLAVMGTTLYVGTWPYGVYRSTDGGNNWIDANSGLTNVLVNSLVAIGTTLYAGLSEGLYRSIDGGNKWNQVIFEIFGSIPRNINSLAVMGTTLYAAADFGGEIYRSTDGGNNWTDDNSGLPTYPDIGSIRSLTVMGTTLYAVINSSKGVYRSTDGGNNWTAANSGLPTYPGINSLAVMGTTLYAGLGYSKGVYRSTDGGNNWTAANSGLPASITVNSLAVMGTTLYAGLGYSEGVYRSTDGGNNWTAANSGLPASITVNSLAVMGTALYAGAYYGVYRSIDGGNNWINANTELTNIPVELLTVIGTTLFAGTQGRGLFRAETTSTTTSTTTIPTITLEDTTYAAMAGISKLIKVKISSTVGISNVKLAYLKGGQPAFILLSMFDDGLHNDGAANDSIWAREIPASFVNLSGLAFYVSATDVNNQIADTISLPTGGQISPTSPAVITVTGDITGPEADDGKTYGDTTAYNGIYATGQIPQWKSRADWTMLSFPFKLPDADPEKAFASWGKVGKDWQTFQYNGGADYDRAIQIKRPGDPKGDVEKFTSIQSGKAAWIWTGDSSRAITIAGAKSNDPTKPFAIRINAGWNQIGNPFRFARFWDKTTFKFGTTNDITKAVDINTAAANDQVGSPAIIYLRSGLGHTRIASPKDDGTVPAGTVKGNLEPWQGYWFLAKTDGWLFIDPTVEGPTSTPPSISPAYESPVVSKGWKGWKGWMIELKANNIPITVGMSSNATNLLTDAMDIPSPPSTPEDDSIIFNLPHPECDDIYINSYEQDIRKLDKSATWDISLKSGQPKSITLTWNQIYDIYSVSDDYELLLVDEASNSKIDLRKDSSYSIKDFIGSRRFYLVASIKIKDERTLGFLDEAIVSRTELGQNFPNPFNPETWIPYKLAKENHVILKIYSSLGKLVRKIDIGEKPAGNYESKGKAIYWDGRNEIGEIVSSGIYFYQFEAGEHISIKKMIMLK